MALLGSNNQSNLHSDPFLCHLNCPMTSDNNRGYQVGYTQVPFPARMCVYCELNSHSAADHYKQSLVTFCCNVDTYASSIHGYHTKRNIYQLPVST